MLKFREGHKGPTVSFPIRVNGKWHRQPDLPGGQRRK